MLCFAVARHNFKWVKIKLSDKCRASRVKRCFLWRSMPWSPRLSIPNHLQPAVLALHLGHIYIYALLFDLPISMYFLRLYVSRDVRFSSSFPTLLVATRCGHVYTVMSWKGILHFDSNFRHFMTSTVVNVYRSGPALHDVIFAPLGMKWCIISKSKEVVYFRFRIV